MNKFHPFLVLLSCTSLLVMSSTLRADYAQEQAQNAKLLQHEIELQKRLREQKYKRQVEDKALNGFANITTGFLEVPKNMINMTNDQDSNIVYGIIGGGIKGLVDTIGRMTVGTFDLLTAPLITKPVVSPQYVWDDFDKSNTYDKIFRLDEAAYAEPPVIQPTAAIVKPRLPVLPDAERYSHRENNRRLDAIFENEMRK